MSARKRDPIAERARQRIDHVARVAIQRLAGATDTASRSVEALAAACVGLSANTTVAELRSTTNALHGACLQLVEALEIVVAEGSALEVVAQVRAAMAPQG